jgi:hypothetical protein
MRLKTRFRAVPLVVAAALAGWGAQTAAGQSRAERRLQEQLDEANRREAEALVEMADRVAAGREVERDLFLDWRHDFLKAQAGTFVPFTVSFDGQGVEAQTGLLYVRVTRRVGTGAAVAASDSKPSAERYPFEAVFPVDLDRERGGLIRLSRGFAVPPGDYDVLVVVRERPANPLASRPGRLKAGVVRQAVTVPDFWTDALAASTVMLAERIEALPEPLGPDEALERPYVIGQNDVHVAFDSTFRKDRELIVVFVIYNPRVTKDRRFDIQVDYHLYRRGAGGAAGDPMGPPADAPAPRPGERYVTRTEPQRFNPALLGARVDPAAGHPVMAGQGILLSSFDEGEYRLGITVTDLLSRQTLTREVVFRVVGS